MRESHRDACAELDRLTPREHEVLTAMVAGLTNDEIATSLVISRNTLEHHITAIYRKLGRTSRIQVILYALGCGHHAPS